MASSAERNAGPSAPWSWLAALRKDWGQEQLAVLLSLIALAGLAWLALLRLTDAMRMPQMVGMAMPPQPWSMGDFILRLAMWVVMMAGMMLPSALPMILLFRQVVRKRSRPVLRTVLFTLPYLLVWSGFSLVATLLQQGLERAAWVSPMAMRGVPWLDGTLLVLAGFYQWLPAKQACLAQCRSPLNFLLRYPLAGWTDAWWLGLVHGGYCVGCCWALMGVLFSVGVMNLLGAAVLAGFVLLEKLLPGPWLSRLAGAMLAGWGVLVWWY